MNSQKSIYIIDLVFLKALLQHHIISRLILIQTREKGLVLEMVEQKWKLQVHLYQLSEIKTLVLDHINYHRLSNNIHILFHLGDGLKIERKNLFLDLAHVKSQLKIDPTTFTIN